MLDTSTGLLVAVRTPSNADAWAYLVSIYSPFLHGWLRRAGVQHADAEDLVQDTLSVVARDLPSFSHNGRPGAFRCWLRGIVANRLRHFLRTRQSRSADFGTDSLERIAEQLSDPADELKRRWDAEHDRFVANRLLAMIEPEFQPVTWQAFQRVACEGIPADRVAAELGISVDSVYVAKSRVLKRLREAAVPLLD